MKLWRNLKIAQLAFAGDFGQQNLVLEATAQHFLHAPAHAGRRLLFLTELIQRIGDNLTPLQPGGTCRETTHHIHLNVWLLAEYRIEQTTHNGAIAAVAAGVVSQN